MPDGTSKGLIERAQWIRHEHGCVELFRRAIKYLPYRVKRLISPRINHYKSKLSFIKYRKKYGEKIPKPYKLIQINPQQVSFLSVPKMTSVYSSEYGTHIRGGDWDRKLSNIQSISENERRDVSECLGITKLEDFEFYNDIDRFVNDETDWKETNTYQNDKKISGKLKAERRYKKIKKITRNILQHGYLSQAELVVKNDNSAETFPHPNFGEVVVNIGRNGNLIFEDGKHRFCIARSLGITEIPVRVFVRHEKWVSKLLKAKNFESACSDDSCLDSVLAHPDS